MKNIKTLPVAAGFIAVAAGGFLAGVHRGAQKRVSLRQQNESLRGLLQSSRNIKKENA